MDVKDNSLTDGIEKLFDTKEMDVQQKIISELISEDNLDRKTELAKPLKWSCLTVIEKFLDEKVMPYSSKILKDFTNLSFRYLISKERKGRTEYVEALKSLSPTNLDSSKIKSLMER